MTSPADLFVVCKQCGSEVSPYITECPYCGSRLRRRAPKLPRAHAPSRPARRRTGIGALLRRSPGAGRRARGVRTSYQGGRWAASSPYATIALAAASSVAWVLFHAWPQGYSHMAIVGSINGEWWKLLTSELAYLYGPYAFVAIVAIALFGWLLERRHGPVLVVALFFGTGAAGALAASAIYPAPLLGGANGPALALLAAWAAPDLRAARSGSYYEGDLLGAAAIAALLLAMPFATAFSGLSWVAGVLGAVVGLAVGLGLSRLEEPES
jgi:membrane associated rhomboid family serine protease